MRVLVFVRENYSKRNPYKVMVAFTCASDTIPYRMIEHRGWGNGSYFVASREQYEEEKEWIRSCNRYQYYRYQDLIPLIQDEVKFPNYDQEFVAKLMEKAGITEVPEEKVEGQLEFEL